MSSTVTRLTGLSSGLDTTSIVESMMSVEQTRIDKQNQLITKLEWKAEAYRDINTKIKNFREQYLSVLNSDSNMLSSASYNINEITMLSTSSAVTITAGATAENGNYAIDSITQLAEEAILNSTSAFTGDSMYTDTTLAELELSTDLVFEDGNISFSINDVEFTFSEDDTIGDMISEINKSDAGVKFSYSNLTKGFTIKSKTTGSDSEVVLVNTTGNAFSATDSAFGIAEGSDSGQDAILSIEGIEVVQSNNSFTIDGISYSLKGESDTSISFNISRDVEASVDKITEFVTAYNELIAELQDMLDEETHSAYEPLTDEEREQLSETEIEEWEDMAKSGQLRNDAYITTLLSTMRSAFYSDVEGLDTNGSDIGISTSAYTEDGQITIDEDVLREALENDPDLLTSLFTETSTETDTALKYNESGIVTRISNAMLAYVDLTVDSSIAGLETQIDEAEERLEVLEDRFATKEDALWTKFSAMEAALSTLNSQSEWLSSLFSSAE